MKAEEMMTGNGTGSRYRLTLFGSAVTVLAVICIYFIYGNNHNESASDTKAIKNMVTTNRDYLHSIMKTVAEIRSSNKLIETDVGETSKNIAKVARNDFSSSNKDNLGTLLVKAEEQKKDVDEVLNQIKELRNTGNVGKSGATTSGQEWESMLSFLHMDAHALCEDIFRAEPGRAYIDKIAEYYSVDAEHDKYLANLNMTELFVDFDGHSSRYREETYVMWNIAKLPFVKTVCETGFNAGHSVHLWLAANPAIQVYSFDNAGFKAARPMADYLDRLYPGRLTVTWGDSMQTLPAFIQQNPHVKCDLMVVDGGHEYDIATADIKNFERMVRGDKNILFMDNYPDRRFGNKHARAWEQFKRRGEVLEIFQCHYQDFLAGFTFGRYLV